MSRTIRKIYGGQHRRKNYYKWYSGIRFDWADVILLNHPCPKDQYRGKWLLNTKVETRRVYGPKEVHYFDPYYKKYNSYTNNYAQIGEETYIAKWYVWEANPDFDEEQDDLRNRWLMAHEYRCRNGTCKRQRKNAVAKDKQAGHQTERARQKQSLRKLVDELLTE